jgi:cell division septum initiation protein DivIVA
MEKLGYNGSADQRNIQYKIDKMDMDKARGEHAKYEGLLAQGKSLSKKNAIMHEHLGKFLQAHDGMKSDKQRQEFIQQAKSRAASAEASSIVAKTAVAKHFAEGLGKKSDEELRDVVRAHVSAPTHIPHTVAHSKVSSNGSSEAIVKPSHGIADEHMAKATNLHVVHQGTSAVIKGTHSETGKPVRVATLTAKSSSGPHKGIVGAFGLK